MALGRRLEASEFQPLLLETMKCFKQMKKKSHKKNTKKPKEKHIIKLHPKVTEH